jgi:hypothetical protein
MMDVFEAQLGIYYERHFRHYHDKIKRSKQLSEHTQANNENNHIHIVFVVPPFNNERQKECEILELIPMITIMIGVLSFE